MSWHPTSACGYGCLPRMSALPRVALWLRVGRILALLAVVCAGLGVALIAAGLSGAVRQRVIRAWFRAVVAATGVRMVVTGVGEPGPALFAANHVSWLDVPVILAIEPMRVLAKSEVRRWPVLGLLAARGGTLFIDRSRLRRLPATIAEIATALRGGANVLVFPEGSTWCGRVAGTPRPATMQAAIDAGVPVRPVSLRYQLANGEPTTVAAFLGPDTIVASVWRVAAIRGLTAHVHLHPVVSTTGSTRRATATAVAALIGTGAPRPGVWLGMSHLGGARPSSATAPRFGAPPSQSPRRTMAGTARRSRAARRPP